MYILSGQHGVRALLDMREKWVQSGRGEMPQWLKVVKADVLKQKTPIAVRQLIAGDEQYRQQNVSRVKVSEFLRHLKNWTPVGKRTEMYHRIADAITKSGWSRPDTKVCQPHLRAAARTPPPRLSSRLRY